MQILIVIWVMLLSFPGGIFCYLLTHNEKNLYENYFAALSWVLAIASAIFISINLVWAYSSIFMLLLIIFWRNGEQIIGWFSKYSAK